MTGSSRPLLDADAAGRLDTGDALAAFANEFHRPLAPAGGPAIYLCGHSLGLQPKAAADHVEQEMADWRRFAVLGHNDARRPWIAYHEALSAPLGQLVGAAPAEVVAMNSLTVNLHLMMVSFFRPAAERRAILMEKSAFPSDRYAILSQLGYHGLDVDKDLIEVEPRPGEFQLRAGDLVEIIERHADRLCLVLLPGVQYLTGQSLPLAPVITAARRAGAAVGLDLAHAIGNTPLHLHDWQVDFAVWCSYKYLNAGPGAIGGCFVHERHAARFDLPRFAGWWGHDKARRFQMGPEFRPIPGAEGWQISNPPILSTAPLLASLEVFRRAGSDRLRAKSLALTGFLRGAIETLIPDRVEIITPTEPESHGCQLSLRLKLTVEAARRCHQRMTAAGVIGDWREPDILRLAPTPLYNSFAEAWQAALVLRETVRA